MTLGAASTHDVAVAAPVDSSIPVGDGLIEDIEAVRASLGVEKVTVLGSAHTPEL